MKNWSEIQRISKLGFRSNPECYINSTKRLFSNNYIFFLDLLPFQGPKNDSGESGHGRCRLHARYSRPDLDFRNPENFRLPLPSLET